MNRKVNILQSVQALRALAVIIVMLTAQTARAEDSGSCGSNLTWALTDENGDNTKETLTISGTGAMDNFDSPPWYDNRENIKTVVIGNGVTSIGQYAFYYCTGLTSITIPSSVTSIGVGAFWNCPALESITVDQNNTKYDSGNGCNAIIETGINTLVVGCKNTVIPSRVTSIGDFAFLGCTGLTSITIPSSVTSIGQYAFYGCTSLTSITIPSSVTSIGVGAFWNCPALETITVDQNNSNYNSGNGCNAIIETDSKTLVVGCKNTVIPSSVTSIGKYAFFCCSSLTSIDIPSSVTSIGDCAFENCTGLTSITIPSSVTSIGDEVFWGCSALTSVIILRPSLTAYGSDVFDKNASGRKIYVPNGSANAYQTGWSEYKNDIVEFDGYCGDPDVNGGKNVFWTLTDNDGDENHTKETLVIAGTGAMRGYDNSQDIPWISQVSDIKTIIIGNGVTSIGENSFYICKNLTSVTIPSSVTTIGKSAFTYCTSLPTVTIPNSVTSIMYAAFYGCTSLTSVTIPASVASIGEDAFYKCTSLTDVYCYADPESLEWTDNGCDDFICDDENPVKTTFCHVDGSKLEAFKDKWSKGSIGEYGTDVNVIFVSDEMATNGEKYLVGITPGTITPTDGVKAFLPVDYDLSTATVKLAEVTGAPKGLPVIFGSATEGEAMPAAISLKYLTDGSDADKAIQTDYADKAKAMSKRFVITDGEQTLAEILDGITDVTANEALFLVLTNGKFTTVSVSAADLNKKAIPGLLLFVLTKWEYMQLGSGSDTNAETRIISIGGEGTATGIEAVENIQYSIFNFQSDSWYDLQGRRLSGKPARKGLYIRNGKKVVM